MQHLYEKIFYHERVSHLFRDEAVIGYMLRFENALAQAQAMHGVIPQGVAAVIASCCQVENIDSEQLTAAAALGGNTAIPLVKQLTALVKAKNSDAAKYVHWGATSQDVIDTAIMLQLQDAVHIIAKDLQQLTRQLAVLMQKHRATVMIGRTFLQQARPITFGYKVAGWLQPLLRCQQAIEALLQDGFVLQLGGAVGTLSAMTEKGLQVGETMSTLLQVNHPPKPWHTERDYFVRVATTLGILTGNLGKIAKDISLLMQTEIAEVLEPSGEGKGGSSAMPHKRNPVGCISILANAARVPALVSTMLCCMVQEHERATGLWHAEWETLADIVQLTAGALHTAVEATDGLEADPAQMLRNIETTRGLVFAENVSLALADAIGKQDAHALIESCCRVVQAGGVHLKDVVLAHSTVMRHLTPAQVEELFDPAQSTGLSAEWTERVWKQYTQQLP